MKKIIVFCLALPSFVYCMEKRLEQKNAQTDDTEIVSESLQIRKLVERVDISPKELKVAQNYWIFLKKIINAQGTKVFFNPQINKKEQEISRKYPNLDKAFMGVAIMCNIKRDPTKLDTELNALCQVVPFCIEYAEKYLDNKKKQKNPEQKSTLNKLFSWFSN